MKPIFIVIKLISTYGSSSRKNAIKHIASKSTTNNEIGRETNTHQITWFFFRKQIGRKMNHLPELIFSFSSAIFHRTIRLRDEELYFYFRLTYLRPPIANPATSRCISCLALSVRNFESKPPCTIGKRFWASGLLWALIQRSSQRVVLITF